MDWGEKGGETERGNRGEGQQCGTGSGAGSLGQATVSPGLGVGRRLDDVETDLGERALEHSGIWSVSSGLNPQG